MKVLFIYEYEYVEPLGIMALSAFLKQNSIDCDFIDLAFEKNLVNAVEKINPDVIAYSLITGKHQFFQKINNELKQKFRFFSVFGGPHPTFFPEFIHEQGVDAICRGEGEQPLLELVRALELRSDYLHIKNLWLKKGEEIVKNDLRGILPIENLSVPDRELIHKYAHYRKKKIRFVITSRGCPYSCTYCFNNGLKKIYRSEKLVRQLTVDKTISDLLYIKDKYHPKRFKFIDDIFTLNKQWIVEFSEKYRQVIGLPFLAHVRANHIDEDVVKALKNAGCTLVEFGIESGSEHIRNDILKRNMTREQIIRVSLLFKKYGIKTLSFNIMGLPDETVENAIETVQLNIDAKIDYAWCGIFHPLPMTELTDYAISQGYYDGGQFLLKDYYIYKKSELKMKNIDQLDRLHFLSSMAVAFPFTLPLIKLMIRIPLRQLYQTIYFIHRAYNYFFKLKQIDVAEMFIFEKMFK